MTAVPLRGIEESPDSKKERCRVTPGRGNPTDSATEMKPLSQKVGQPKPLRQ
jgi:hypothetical protein